MEQLSSTLKFIAQIRRDEKINTKNLTVTHNTYKTSFYRTFFENESRQTTLLFLQNSLYQAVQLLDEYVKKKTQDVSSVFVRSLIIDLIGSKDGIRNLKHTYSDDRIFKCQLDTLILYIESFLAKLFNISPELFPHGYKRMEASNVHTFADIAFEHLHPGDMSPSFEPSHASASPTNVSPANVSPSFASPVPSPPLQLCEPDIIL